MRIAATLARIPPRVAFWAMAGVALFLSHDAVFLVQVGPGDALSRALRDAGHDYWGAASLILALVGLAVGAAAVLRLRLASAPCRSASRAARRSNADRHTLRRRLAAALCRRGSRLRAPGERRAHHQPRPRHRAGGTAGPGVSARASGHRPRHRHRWLRGRRRAADRRRAACHHLGRAASSPPGSPAGRPTQPARPAAPITDGECDRRPCSSSRVRFRVLKRTVSGAERPSTRRNNQCSDALDGSPSSAPC